MRSEELVAIRRLLAISRSTNDDRSGFVADGYDHLVSHAEAEARRIVEERYADEWNRSGLIRRWGLQRKMKLEIDKLVAEMLPDVSDESCF